MAEEELKTAYESLRQTFYIQKTVSTLLLKAHEAFPESFETDQTSKIVSRTFLKPFEDEKLSEISKKSYRITVNHQLQRNLL